MVVDNKEKCEVLSSLFRLLGIFFYKYHSKRLIQIYHKYKKILNMWEIWHIDILANSNVGGFEPQTYLNFTASSENNY